MVPIILHALFAALIVYLDLHTNGQLGLPASIVRPLDNNFSLELIREADSESLNRRGSYVGKRAPYPGLKGAEAYKPPGLSQLTVIR